MKLFHALFALLISIESNGALAFKIVESYCNDKAKMGDWMVGAPKQKKVNGIITNEFDKEHSWLISYLDKLPVQTNDTQVMSDIKIKPSLHFKIMKGTRLQWEIEGKESGLVVIMQFYKECISNISLMDSVRMRFFMRSNELPIQP